MKPTLFLLGPSDTEEQNTVSGEAVGNGRIRVDMTLAGVVPILPFIEQDRILKTHSRSVVLGAQRVPMPSGPRFNVFNLVGDADSSPRMLGHVQTVLDKLQPLRCFNRPSDVFKTTRAALPGTLEGVPGCLVPRVEAVDTVEFRELQEACRAFGEWPLIIRSRGEHGGKQMLLLQNLGELDAHEELPWLYKGVCLIEYIDYQDADGFYQKNRVIVIDGVPYPRHALFTREWMVHAGSRAGLMSEDQQLRRREQEFIANEVQQYTPVFEDMYRRIGLDIFGVDFALVEGKVLVFEANACMKFLERQQGGETFSYLEDYVKAIRRAIKTMLVQA
jgi:hypothetical protein